MKTVLSVLLASIGLTSVAWAQTASPAASVSAASPSAKAATASAGAPASRPDLYHVHFAKAAAGKAAALGESLKKQDPESPMQGHYMVLRHMDGDVWDYCVVEHLGTKATVDAARPARAASEAALDEWHTDTYVTGPAWADFAKQMGLDDASKSGDSAFIVSVYRPVPGQRDALDKFLSEPPDPALDSTVGNAVMQHAEGAAWSFFTIGRYSSWSDFAKDEVRNAAQMDKKDGGWYKLRDLAAYHTDTLADRMTP